MLFLLYTYYDENLIVTVERLFYNLCMEENGKKINLYRGIWIAFTAMFVLPILTFILFYFILNIFSLALALSSLIGFLFGVSCWIAGFTKDLFAAFKDRVRETHELFDGIFTKDGFKWYFGRFIEDGGIVLWLFFLIIIAFGVVSAISFIDVYNTYLA